MDPSDGPESRYETDEFRYQSGRNLAKAAESYHAGGCAADPGDRGSVLSTDTSHDDRR